MTRHRLFNPEGMPSAVGFSHGALGAGGRLLRIAGQTGHHGDGSIDTGLVDQFAQACRSVVNVIEDAGGTPEDLLSLTIYTTDVAGYRENLGPIGAVYREAFGHHYPAMALIGISELFDPEALIELVAVAQVEA